MKRLVLCLFLVTVFACETSPRRNPPATNPEVPWQFAVSGDSRNCGNIIMPAIAEKAKADGAKFYIHLGDFRALFKIDEDLAHDSKPGGSLTSLDDYKRLAWSDFMENQLTPFGEMPVYLVIGNHELIGRTRADYVAKFRKWLELPEIERALKNDGGGQPNTYYHWREGGVEFIALDNGSSEQFDAQQMDWFRKVLAKTVVSPEITTIILTMHQALPDSISFKHSMSESTNPNAVSSGREVYLKMLEAQNKFKKKIYILGSHSHYYMDGTFNTSYWQTHGGVLPGWIVGTAGAERNPLPPKAVHANLALEKTYGYLLGTVFPTSGEVRFKFVRLEKTAVPTAVVAKYGREVVNFCFAENFKLKMLPH